MQGPRVAALDFNLALSQADRAPSTSNPTRRLNLCGYGSWRPSRLQWRADAAPPVHVAHRNRPGCWDASPGPLEAACLEGLSGDATVAVPGPLPRARALNLRVNVETSLLMRMRRGRDLMKRKRRVVSAINIKQIMNWAIRRSN